MILWGTFGAIAIRAAMAVLVVYILDLPGFMLAGGLALIWIARKLVAPDAQAGQSHAAAAPAVSFAGAVRTIVMAIGGVAGGSVLLVVLGLAISVPLIVWGSQLVIRLVDRFPSVVLLGGLVLAWTGYSMIVREPFLLPWFEAHAAIKPVVAVAIFTIALAPWCSARLAVWLKRS